ncbi:PRC-barrel domain-containing protein [Salinicola halophilus]|uniref:PRC-barrel domain-containing protein n=1 Tax=Salinicola halophilus TaxID=184065 RepID=UPI000DA13C31|nr:PRC-barrel domain-containing protein [Salinicola halophilus]
MRTLTWKQTFGAALIAGTAMTQTAVAQEGSQQDVQGLYSAEELMDADVYLTSSPNDEVGEVEDILLGEDMGVQALVIEAGGVLDMGDREFVVEKGDFTVETERGDDLDDLEYRILLNMDESELEQRPEYDNDWWQHAKNDAADAWENTKQNANSAWNDTKAATSSLLKDAGEALDDN